MQEQEEQEKTAAGVGGGSGGWQGWLTGWYSWYPTDTTDGVSNVRQGKDVAPMFMGEPPTTKGEWILASLFLSSKIKPLWLALLPRLSSVTTVSCFRPVL